jgi:hypothetical protein
MLVAAVAVPGRASPGHTATQTFNLGVDNIARVGVSGNPAALILDAPATGGDDLPAATDSTTTLRYTSVVSAYTGGHSVGQQQSRGMQVGITAGTVPYGTTLDLGVTAPTGGDIKGTAGFLYGPGTYTLGYADTAQHIAAAQLILQGIKSCITGTATGTNADGAHLTYTLKTSDWRYLKVDTGSDITVTFTLMQDPSP